MASTKKDHNVPIDLGAIIIAKIQDNAPMIFLVLNLIVNITIGQSLELNKFYDNHWLLMLAASIVVMLCSVSLPIYIQRATHPSSMGGSKISLWEATAIGLMILMIVGIYSMYIATAVKIGSFEPYLQYKNGNLPLDGMKPELKQKQLDYWLYHYVFWCVFSFITDVAAGFFSHNLYAKYRKEGGYDNPENVKERMEFITLMLTMKAEQLKIPKKRWKELSEDNKKLFISLMEKDKSGASLANYFGYYLSGDKIKPNDRDKGKIKSATDYQNL